MSFSGKVREELAGNISSARHCRIAELAAFIGMCGTIAVNSFDQYSIKIHSENFLVARKVFTLIEKTFNIKVDVSIRRNIKRQNATYSVVVRQHEDAVRILQAVKMIGGMRIISAISVLSVRWCSSRRAAGVRFSAEPFRHPGP